MIEEAIHENRRKIFTGRMVFLLYVAVYSCAIFIPLAIIFIKEAGVLGLVTILVSLALWATMLALAFYFNADIVRRATGAVPLEEGRFPRFVSAAEDIAIASGQEVPRLMLIDDQAANAFSLVSLRERRGVVFCTEGLARLHPDEIRAVMAHELAHLRNGDAEIGSLIVPFGALSGLTVKPITRLSGNMIFQRRPYLTGLIILLLLIPLEVVGIYSLYSFMQSDTSATIGEALVVVLFGLLLPLVSLYLLGILVSLYWSFTLRKREYLADDTALEWTNYPEGMIDALLSTCECPLRSGLAFLDDSCFAPPTGTRGFMSFQTVRDSPNRQHQEGGSPASVARAAIRRKR